MLIGRGISPAELSCSVSSRLQLLKHPGGGRVETILLQQEAGCWDRLASMSRETAVGGTASCCGEGLADRAPGGECAPAQH